MKRNVHKYTDKLKALVIKECTENGLDNIIPTCEKYGIPKSTVHGWLYPDGKHKVKEIDNTAVVVQKLAELNDKIDKLIKAWEIK